MDFRPFPGVLWALANATVKTGELDRAQRRCAGAGAEQMYGPCSRSAFPDSGRHYILDRDIKYREEAKLALFWHVPIPKILKQPPSSIGTKIIGTSVMMVG